MNDALEVQLINELTANLKEINKKYKDFYHFQLLTLVEMKDNSCDQCKTSETNQQCLRCVVGIKDLNKEQK